MIIKERNKFVSRLFNLSTSSLMYNVLKHSPIGFCFFEDNIKKNFIYSLKNNSINSYDVIHIKDVVGTNHPDYVGNTWLDYFYDEDIRIGRGKRLDLIFKNYLENPFYYVSKEKKEGMCFYNIVNDGIYIMEGNNRSHMYMALYCLEEIPGFIYGVKVFNYVFDKKNYDLYIYLKEKASKKNYSLEVYRENDTNIYLLKDRSSKMIKSFNKLESVEKKNKNSKILFIF